MTQNYKIEGKEYVLQHTNKGYRCISWHPHYIMTDWVKHKITALFDGDKAIEKFYSDIVAFDRIIKPEDLFLKENKNDQF